MINNTIGLRKALNKSFLKVKPHRSDIELFKGNLIDLLNQINESESEEYHKNILSTFLNKTYYASRHYINTKGRNDLVIHHDDNPKSDVGVILEVKKPTNKPEMVKLGNLNTKAFHELILYFLRERISLKNKSLKYLIISNIHEWFIFDAQIFERYFAENKNLVRQFKDFEEKRLSGVKTDFFYREIAQPLVAEIGHLLEFTYFDINDYQKALRNSNKADDTSLIALYKLLSPQHILKLPFANDSNTLDRNFYSELLHIIGLKESTGDNRIITRPAKGERNNGSLLENAIQQIESMDKIQNLERPSEYGVTHEDRLFNVGLELIITWINRILFLKLLEAQLLSYHKKDDSYQFLNLKKITNFDDLNSLFFSVLAIPQNQRNSEVTGLFSNIPYLNSTLFEVSDIEHKTIAISNLKDDRFLPLFVRSVLKNQDGNLIKKTELNTLEYLFEFLNAYDFSSEGSEEIQEENKKLINASVLGLIFEKINGYKDGSFFTPGFITMYMARETIRKSVIQKFNLIKGWNCSSMGEIYDQITDKKEANEIINSLTICDPAVGSGHFLVSCLNELISIKSELKILLDQDGRTLRDYHIEVENDELIVTDDDGRLFEYSPGNRESQNIQHTLFREKQTIIENCLFGVDINPNSVRICRLRLWIELLKSTYYKTPTELETLPNIDINIKCGNSLVARFELDSDLKGAFKETGYTLNDYKEAVYNYKHTNDKTEKKRLNQMIEKIKTGFKNNIDNKFKTKIAKSRGNLINLEAELNRKMQWGEKIPKKLTDEIKKAKVKFNANELERTDREHNAIYINAFEWRFEFPEVLNDEGAFMGFDILIGNPPYGVKLSKKIIENVRERIFQSSETAILFIALARNLLKNQGLNAYIIPKAFTFSSNYKTIRDLTKKELSIIVDCHKPWQEVKLEACLYILQKNVEFASYGSYTIIKNEFVFQTDIDKSLIDDFDFILNGLLEEEIALAKKILSRSVYLGTISSNKRGAGIQRDISPTGQFAVLGGIDIARNHIRDSNRGFITSKENLDPIATIKDNSVLVQNIVAHLTKPVPHLKIIATVPPADHEKYVILDTINQITFNEGIDKYFGNALLNSQVINWYVYNFIYGKAIRTMHFDNVVTNRIPFPKSYYDEKAGIDQQIHADQDHIIFKLFELDPLEIEIISKTF